MLSNLQLESYRLLCFHIEANPDFDPETESPVGFMVKTDFNMFESKDPPRFQIPLHFSLEPQEITPAAPVKKLEVKIEGIFKIEPGTPEEEIHRLVPYNCIAMLYSLARGLVCGVTGSLQSGVFILPTLNFKGVIERKLDEMGKGKPKKGKAKVSTSAHVTHD